MTYVYLLIAIAFETIGTAGLQASEQFTKLKPLALTAVCYATAFYFLSLTLRTIPLGISYAIWSGVGVALVALLSWAV